MPGRKRIVVIGETGSGKSSLCNVLAGRPANGDFFPVGHGCSSKTWETTVRQAKWNGDAIDIEIIDTPGLDDAKGAEEDEKNITDMIKKLKDLDTIHLFLLVINGAKQRLTRSLIEIVRIFHDMFGEDFLGRTVLGVSNWSFNRNVVKTRGRQSKTEASLTEDLFKKFVDAGVRFKKSIPTVFIDSHFDRKESDENDEFKKNMALLMTELQKASPFGCKGFKEVKPNILIVKERTEEEKRLLEEAKKQLSEACERSKEEMKSLEIARSRLLEACARSDKETASRFLRNLSENLYKLQCDFPPLLNSCFEDVKNLCQAIGFEHRDNVEGIVKELTPLVEKLSESFRSCLRNASSQNTLIDEKLSFLVAREKHLRDLKVDRECDLKSDQLEMESVQQEIRQAEDAIRLAEERVWIAEDAVRVARKKKKEAITWGSIFTVIGTVVGGVLGGLIGGLVLADATQAAGANVDAARNIEANTMFQVPILYEKKALSQAHFYKQKQHVAEVENDLRSLEEQVHETKQSQKAMRELMTCVKNDLFFVAQLQGKGEVLRKTTIGNIFLVPIISVLRDLVSHIQTYDNPMLDWNRVKEDLDGLKNSGDSLSIEVDPDSVMDLSDFL